MIALVLRRAAQMIPVLLGVTLVAFLLTYRLPGDPARADDGAGSNGHGAKSGNGFSNGNGLAKFAATPHRNGNGNGNGANHGHGRVSSASHGASRTQIGRAHV